MKYNGLCSIVEEKLFKIVKSSMEDHEKAPLIVPLYPYTFCTTPPVSPYYEIKITSSFVRKRGIPWWSATITIRMHNDAEFPKKESLDSIRSALRSYQFHYRTHQRKSAIVITVWYTLPL